MVDQDKVKHAAIVIFIVVAGFGAGVLVGWYSGPDRVVVDNSVGSPEEIMQMLSNTIDNEVIDDTLR